jgi:hypothetical protein
MICWIIFFFFSFVIFWVLVFFFDSCMTLLLVFPVRNLEAAQHIETVGRELKKRMNKGKSQMHRLLHVRADSAAEIARVSSDCWCYSMCPETTCPGVLRVLVRAMYLSSFCFEGWTDKHDHYDPFLPFVSLFNR